MGIAYHVDAATGLSISVLDGEVTADEYHELARRQDDDPTWHAATRSLTDARTVLTTVISAGELGAFAAVYGRMRATDPPWRAAIVAGHDFALAGRYSEFRTDDRTLTIPFDDLPSACIWLDADLEAVRRTIAELRDGMRQPSVS